MQALVTMQAPDGWMLLVLPLLLLVDTVRTIPEPPTTTVDPRQRNGFFPNPRVDLLKCGIRDGRPSSICNSGRQLRQETVVKADVIIDTIRNQSTCPCEVDKCRGDHRGGYKLGVAVVQSLALGEEDGSGASSEHIGKAVSDKIRLKYWKLGACDEDIILLLAIAEGRLYLSVGEMAQRAFVYQCELELGHQFMRIVREKDIGNYDKGLLLALNDIKAILLDHRLCGKHVAVLRWWHMVILGFAALFIILIIVGAVKMRSRTASNNTTVT